MVKRRPPVQLPPSGGRAGDVRPPGAGPPPRPPGEHPAWRAVRGVLATATWVALATLAVTGVWLWLEYVPVPEATVGARPLTDQQDRVAAVQDIHVAATWGLGFAGALWLAAIAATSPTSRRLVATGALLALLGGGAAVWTGLGLPWEDAIYVDDPRTSSPGQPAGIPPPPGGGLLRDDVETYVVEGNDRSPGTFEGLAWGHVLGALLVLVGLGTAAGLARARRRRPDDDAMPANRTARRGPSRITLPADVEAPARWTPTGDPPPGAPDEGGDRAEPAPPDPLEAQPWWPDAGDGDPPSPGGPTGGVRP